jgi:nicotinate phosphoribosyltransferase
MGQVLLHQFPNEQTTWDLTIRSKGVKTAYLKDEVEYQVDHLCELKHGWDELNFLASIPWFSPDYIDWLEDLRLKRKNICVYADGDDLHVHAEGKEIQIQWYETLVMPIIQELWMLDQDTDYELGKQKLDLCIGKYNKLIDEGKKFTLADFGTRRRASYKWQEYVVQRLVEKCKAMVGTSNVYMAMKFGIKPIGTFAHQMPMLLQGNNNIRLCNAQRATFDAWVKEYRGDLGIFLSDTFGFKAFLYDFDKFYAKLSNGCRHDSEDPFLWGDILIEFYKQLMIDPKTKVGCWSDSLKDDDVVNIVDYFWDRINVSIGQGTFLTNNVGGNPLNMVMKMSSSNGISSVKLADVPGKCNCKDEAQIEEVKRAFNYVSLAELSYLKGNPEAIKQFVAEIIAAQRQNRVWRG